MPDSELSDLLSSKSEDLSVEYKAWLDTRDPATRAKLAKHFAALCNHGGGFLVFGVQDQTRAPMGETTYERQSFNQDELAGIVQRYLDPRPAIRVEEAERDGVRYPVVIVPPHGPRPVIAIADGPQDGAGRPIGIRKGAVYIRASGPESVSISSPDDWNALFDRCLANRADHLGAILRTALARPGRPLPSAGATLTAAVDATADDFEFQIYELSLPPQYVKSAYSVMGYSLIREDGGLVELHGIRSLNQRVAISMREFAYNGWAPFLPLTFPQRAPQIRTDKLLGEDQVYLEGMRLSAMGTLPGALDYWRIYEAGVAATAQSYREDSHPDGRPSNPPFLNVKLVLWRVHSLLAHARLVGQETPGVQQVSVRMDWRGLAGRMLTWDFRDGYAANGTVVDNRFAKTILLNWADLRYSYFQSLRRVVLPVFDLFEGGGGRSMAELLTRTAVTDAFEEFGKGARLFED